MPAARLKQAEHAPHNAALIVARACSCSPLITYEVVVAGSYGCSSGLRISTDPKGNFESGNRSSTVRSNLDPDKIDRLGLLCWQGRHLRRGCSDGKVDRATAHGELLPIGPRSSSSPVCRNLSKPSVFGNHIGFNASLPRSKTTTINTFSRSSPI